MNIKVSYRKRKKKIIVEDSFGNKTVLEDENNDKLDESNLIISEKAKAFDYIGNLYQERCQKRIPYTILNALQEMVEKKDDNNSDKNNNLSEYYTWNGIVNTYKYLYEIGMSKIPLKDYDSVKLVKSNYDAATLYFSQLSFITTSPCKEKAVTISGVMSMKFDYEVGDFDELKNEYENEEVLS